jgi:hypothetical protein
VKDLDAESCNETDDRFPSGPWIGYFLQREIPGKHWMDLDITFRDGRISGAGGDWVGRFALSGSYSVEDGRCEIAKRYLGKHVVDYRGYNEGRGIWGAWEIPPHFRGGFHIWPKAMGDLSEPKLAESADLPLEEALVVGGE